MTHKPTARPKETQLGMLADSDSNVSLATRRDVRAHAKSHFNPSRHRHAGT